MVAFRESSTEQKHKAKTLLMNIFLNHNCIVEFKNLAVFCRVATLPSCFAQRDLNTPDVVITTSKLLNTNKTMISD